MPKSTNTQVSHYGTAHAEPAATRRRFRWLVIASAAYLVLVPAVLLVLAPQAARLFGFLSSIVAELLALTCLLWTVRRARGAERRWRMLFTLVVAVSLVASTQTLRSIAAEHALIPDVSEKHLSYLLLFLVIWAGLLAFPTEPLTFPDRGSTATGYRWLGIIVLDGLLVVGSVVLLAWMTVLRTVVATGQVGSADFLLAVGNAAAAVLLVTTAILLTAFRRSEPVARLRLLALGFTAYSISVSGYSYVVGLGKRDATPLLTVGLTCCFLCIALAAVAPRSRPLAANRDRRRPLVLWAHLALPYLPLTGVGLLFAVQLAAETDMGAAEMYGLIALLMLALLRQMMTLLDNSRLLARVHRQAFHDPLTGLANRALFTDRLQQALARHAHQHQPVSLLFCDLDDFKDVNDTLGHDVGDELLRTVACRLNSGIRSRDTVARLGGDEFAVLLDGNIDGPDAVGERLTQGLRAPCMLAGHPYTIYASIGLVTAEPADCDVTPETLLQRADLAMYAAKRRGKGVLTRYQPELWATRPAGDLQRATLARALRDEPSGGVLDVDYLPIVDLRERRTVALEARTRWSHPSLGSLPASALRVAAAEAHLGSALDAASLRRACGDIAMLRVEDAARIAVLVPISPAHASQNSLRADLTESIALYGVPPSALILGVAEPDALEDLPAMRRFLAALADCRVRIAIDRVSGGAGTIAAVSALPVQFVKLDPRLCQLDPEDSRQAETTRLLRAGLLSAVRKLRLTTVATGIITWAQADQLAADGCDLGEGDLFGPPGPIIPGTPRGSQSPGR